MATRKPTASTGSNCTTRRRERSTCPDGSSPRRRGWRLRIAGITGPLNLRFRYHQAPDDAGVGRLLTASDLLDPRLGDFYRPEDKEAIVPVLERIALEYQEYEESGSQVWDTLIDVSARPQWLKDLAVAAVGSRSSRTSRRSSRALSEKSSSSISSTAAGDDAVRV